MTEIPDAVDEWLDGLTADQLDDVARLLQRRAEEKRRQEWRAEETDVPEGEQSKALDVQGDPLPEGVPAKATLTKKTINDNEYWYWQWRTDDGTVTSKYKCPVDGS